LFLLVQTKKNILILLNGYQSKSNDMKTNKKVRILSLDGGGIRGVIPATILTWVEKELQRLSGNPDAKLADFFDMIVGTSTGGLIGCFLLVPDSENPLKCKNSAAEALKFYEEKGSFIFSKRTGWIFRGIDYLRKGVRFPADNLESLLEKEFANLRMAQLTKHALITAYDLNSSSAVFFNSREVGKYKEEREFLVRDVLRSTSAAPTYFAPAKIKNLSKLLLEETFLINLDGGVFANNPTMCAYAEARSTNFEQIGLNKPSAKDMLVLSIGTGATKKRRKNRNNSGKKSLLGWASSISDIMMDGGLDTVNYQVNRIFESLEEEYRGNYLRLNVPMKYRTDDPDDPNVQMLYQADMTDASPENIKNLKRAGELAIEAELQKGQDGSNPLHVFMEKLVAVEKARIAK
jgi:uncharacterized protein